MKYTLLIHGDPALEQAIGTPELAAMMAGFSALSAPWRLPKP